MKEPTILRAISVHANPGSLSLCTRVNTVFTNYRTLLAFSSLLLKNMLTVIIKQKRKKEECVNCRTVDPPKCFPIANIPESELRLTDNSTPEPQSAMLKAVWNTTLPATLSTTTVGGVTGIWQRRNTLNIVNKRGWTHRWRPDLADPSFLSNGSYFVDVRKRLGKFFPAGLKHRALRRGDELIQRGLSHLCIFV